MPAEITRLFAALRPDVRLDALVAGYKRRLQAAAGPQLYATDPPHVTLLVGSFASARVAEVLHTAGELAGTIPPPQAVLAGWHVFRNDPLTGRHTFVCNFDEATCHRLRVTQLRVLSGLVPLCDLAATQDALAPRREFLSADQRRCVAQFGYPYVGGGWIPHLTIASVRPSEWPHVEAVFPLVPDGRTPVHDIMDGTFSSLDVFELQGVEPLPLASFPLVGRPIGKVA